MAQLLLDDSEHHGDRDRRAHRRAHVERAGSEAPDDGRLHRPEAHLREAERQGDHEVPGARGRRLRAVRDPRAEARPVLADGGEPELLGRRADRRRGRLPALQQPGRDGRRAPQPARSTRSTTCRRTRSSSSSRREGIVAVQGQQGGFEELAINGGQGLKKPHPALMDIRVRQAIAHAIDEQTLIDRVLVGLGAPTDAMSPSANPAFIPEIPEDDRFDFDLDEGAADPRRRGLHGHGRRRRPRDAGRRQAARLRLRGAHRVADRAGRGRVRDRLAEARSGSRSRRSR